MGIGITVIPFCKIPVIGCDDGVLWFIVFSVTRPLPDTRSAGISQNNSTDFFEILKQAIAFSRETNLFRAGSDYKF